MILETILNGNNNKVIILTKEKKIKPPLEFSGSYKNRIYEMGDFTYHVRCSFPVQDNDNNNEADGKYVNYPQI